MLRIVTFIILTFIAINPVLAEDNKRVVASTTQIADFVRQVAGDRVKVISILAPGADPHTYQPTPKDVELVTGSDLCFENGMHLEGKNWMAGLARDAAKPIVTVTDGIQPIDIGEDGETLADPHTWFAPSNVTIYVTNIVKALSTLEPDYSDEFVARAKLFLRQLRVLDGWIKEQVSTIPAERRVLVTTHDAFNYFCREYKFNPSNDYLSIAPVGWSTGAEVGGGMTPARRAMVVKSIKESGAPAIFVETTINPKQIREIARDTGVVVGGSLYSDSMGVEGSAGETYIGMMRENVLTIVRALR